MIPLEEFKTENKEIRDLCNILGVTVDHFSLRNNRIVCELQDRFADCVTAHLEHEDRSIYRDLLKSHTRESDQLADKFLGNTQQLKTIFNEYKKGWCRKPHKEKDHSKYVDESRAIFKTVCDRINFEEEMIFPHFEK